MTSLVKSDFFVSYRPTRPCFVCRTALDGRRHPWRVDQVVLFDYQLKYIFASCKKGYKRDSIRFSPIELNIFRSRRWCVGNEEINQMFEDYELKLIDKFKKKTEVKEDPVVI